MKILLKVILLLNCFHVCYSQPWQSTSSPIDGISTLVHQGNALAPNYGRQGNTGFSILENTMHPEGGRIMVSTTLDQGAGVLANNTYTNARIRIQSTRPNSTILFDKVYGFEVNSDLTPTGFDYNLSENGYAISGVSTKMDGIQKKSVFFMKIDNNGNKKSAFVYNIDPPAEYPSYTNQVALEMVSRKTGLENLSSMDGCYYIVGYSTPDIIDGHHSDKIPFLISINKNGQLLWVRHSLRHSEAEIYNSIKEIPNSGIVVGGTSYGEYDLNVGSETVFTVTRWDYNGNQLASVQYEAQQNFHGNQQDGRYIADMLYYPELQKLYVLSWKDWEEVPELAELNINNLDPIRYIQYHPQFTPSMSATLLRLSDSYIGISGYCYSNGQDMDRFIMPVDLTNLSALYFKRFQNSQTANSEFVYTAINKFQQQNFNGGAHISGPFLPNVSFVKSYDNGNNLELSFVSPRLHVVAGLPGPLSMKMSIVTDVLEHYLPSFSNNQISTCFSELLPEPTIFETQFEKVWTHTSLEHSLRPFTSNCVQNLILSLQNDNLNSDCFDNTVQSLNDIYFTTNIAKHPTSANPLGGEIEVDASTLNGIVQLNLAYQINDPNAVLIGNKFSNLGPGEYEIELFNNGVSKGKKKVTLVLNAQNVFDPCLSQPIMSINVIQPTCGTAGSISISTNSGVAPYSYKLTRAGLTRQMNQTTSVFSNLGPGVYTITAIDVKGQFDQKQFTIIAPNYSQTNLAGNDNLAAAHPMILTQAYDLTNVNWDDSKHAVNHQLYSANQYATRNASIQLGEFQPFEIEFGQKLEHSVWFKFYVPNIASRVRLFTQLGTLLNARTAIAVYKSNGNVCNPVFSDLIEVARHFESPFTKLPNSFYPKLPIARRLNNATIPLNLNPVDACLANSTLENDPVRSYIEFEADADQIYYVQVFMINPNYNPNTFIDANINQNNQCFVDDRLFLSVDIEPHSNIHFHSTINSTEYKVEMNRVIPDATYLFYTRATAITANPSNYCTVSGATGPWGGTASGTTVISDKIYNSFYFGAYQFNSSKCGLTAGTVLTRVHDKVNPAPAGQSLKTDGTSSIESLTPESKGIVISPNPASIELNIQIDYNSINAHSYEIININGQMIAGDKIDKSSNDFKVKISEFVNGNYIIHFRDEERNVLKSYKFIKE